ncbi:MAG: hypothetical protein LBR27_07335 [Bifidobacteriaceae bacterium]|jgi:tetratricopeptide (TPR) repeat protein|nr:hypothetical protein [Bifidobacteriaceae bacterium]
MNSDSSGGRDGRQGARGGADRRSGSDRSGSASRDGGTSHAARGGSTSRDGSTSRAARDGSTSRDGWDSRPARTGSPRGGRGAGGRGGGDAARRAEQRQREAWREQDRAKEAGRMRPKNRLDEASTPIVPEHITPEDLPEPIRRQLAGLGKQNGAQVARHLVMVLECLEEAPEVAYQHARAAADRAGRITVVREYAALASYYSGRWAEAVREIRTYQRLSGTSAYPQLLADALRGVGKPREALDVIQRADLTDLDETDRLELVLVQAGARADLGEYDAALALLAKASRQAQLPDGAPGRLALARRRIEALRDGAAPADEEWMDEADELEAAAWEDQA